ncbi:MAG: hypothetical protein IKG86_00200 [Paludibacteraceae bacterium]|nr:hypothetical protein [Paludibacteraceae bacterium]
MKKHLLLKLLALFVVLITSIATAGAYTYTPTGAGQQAAQTQQTMQSQQPAIQSHQMMHGGSSYQGQVYTPFSGEVPSSQSSPARISGPRREKIDTGDEGEGGEGGEGWLDKPDYGGTDLSPIGEPWIMALFALAFAGVIAIRQYKRKTVKSMNMKNSTSKFIATLALLCTLGVGQMWASFSGGTEVFLDLQYNQGSGKWVDAGARFAIYVEKGGGSKWASMAAHDDGPKTGSGAALIHSATIPDGTWDKLIFVRMNGGNSTNDWSNKWAQSADILEPSGSDGKNCFVLNSDYSSPSGSWQYVSLSGRTIYFDTRNYKTWTNPYLRIGRSDYCSSYALTKVAGTEYLWSCSSPAWSNYHAYTITNAEGPTGSSQSVYNESMSMKTNHVGQNITQTRYITPNGTGDSYTGGQYYTISNETSVPSYKIYFSAPAHGSLVVEKYDGSSYVEISDGDAVLPTQRIRITKTPDTGYELNTFSAGSNVTLISGNDYYVTEDNTISASFRAKTYTVTLNKGNGTSAGNVTSVSATYDAVLGTNLTSTGNLPTITTNGYGFAGYFSGENGTGTQFYNMDGTPTSNVWNIDEVSPTLYAYFKPAEMSLALAAITIGTGEGDSATVSITPAVGSPAFNQVGTIMFCYDVKIKNGASMDPQPEGRQFTEGGVLKYRFASPRYSGNYTLNVKLRAGSDCSGAQIDSKDIDFIVSGDHTVTIRHKCGDVEIHEPTTVTIHPGETGSAVGFEDADVFGYHFSTWTIGGASGVTKASGELTDRTITISAIYDGTITATYTRRNLIYFKNTLNWPDVWIHFLGAKKWDTTQGTGNRDQTNRNKHMTRIGETNVWYFDYTAADITPNGFEVFTDRSFPGDDSNGFGYFHGTSSADPALVSFPIVYDNTDDDDTRYGFHAGTPMFVPVDQTPYQTTVNSDANKIANNYNRGYWREYEPVTGKTGYTLKVYDRCEATDRKELQSKAMTDGSGDAIFEATVDLEAGKTYGIKFLRGSDWYYTNTDSWKGDKPVATVFPTNESSVACYQLGSEYAAIQLNTTVSGNYTFKIYCSASEGKLKMSVKYPAGTNDYRIVYHDNATWTPENGAHAAGWIHPSHVITKRDGGEDIVSFFVKANASPKFKFQKITGLNPVAWSDVETGEGDHFINVPDSITDKGTGVYNFHLKQEGSSISVVKIEPYTGNYYIRTDNAGSTKWSDFRASDHLMTYSEYADKKGNFTHYFMKFVEVSNRKNVKFCIANDYSMCISDTLTRQSSDYSGSDFSHVDANGDIDADANIRFMWNMNTNALSRKYLARAQSDGTYFLVLKGQEGKIADKDGTRLTNENDNNKGVGNDEIQFSDDQDWIYEAQVQATPGGRIKLYARYDGEDQYFYGDNDASFTDTHGEELIGGSGAAEVIRAIYDFKTNRLMAAWVPSGTISSNKTIEADIMLVREQQNGGGQINLTNSATLTTSTNKQIYGVMRFNRWDLNNLSRTNTGTNENPIHAALDPGDQKSAYERFNYFISFPFDVKVGEIFGFGRIGRHYRIYFYDGIGRAQEGYFAERKSNWKMIDDTDSILHAYQGYLLQLNSVRMATTQEDVWPQANQDQVELYFPAMRAVSSITTANETIPALALDGPYKCTKDLSSTYGGNADANRTLKDSYWRCIGTPSFANYEGNFEGWTGFHYQINSEDVPYLYQWETTTNKLIPVTSNNFEFLSMHAYLIQNPNQIVWANVSKPTYSAVVTRTRDAEAEREWKLTLTNNNEELLDQAFVRMSDNEAVTANFDFGQDLVKEWNEDANIYTFVGPEQVAANSMPFSDQTTIVPVGVKIAADGEYTFAMPEGTNGTGVYLIDNIAGTRTNLALTDYTVNLAAGTYDGRFSLEISPIAQTPTDIDNVEGDNVQGTKVRKVMVDGILYIVKDGQVFDARGNRIQ